MGNGSSLTTNYMLYIQIMTLLFVIENNKTLSAHNM